MLSGQSVDPTDGALFYHTRAIRPWWSRYGHGATVIGAHIFYRDVPDQVGRRGRARVTHVADNSSAQRGPRAGRVNGTIQHNLRTLILNPDGTIRRLFTDENWTVDEMVTEVVGAGR